HPGAVAAAQVAHHERVLLPGDLGVQRGQEHILRKPDVAVLAADGRVGSGALETLRGSPRVVEQHEGDAAAGTRSAGRDAACQPRIPDGRATGGAEARGGCEGGAAAPAGRTGAGRAETTAAVRAKRPPRAGAAAAERAVEPLARGHADGRRERARPRNRGRLPLRSRGLAHRFAAIHTELRGGLIVAAAVGASGHMPGYPTGRTSYGMPIYSANWRVERADATLSPLCDRSAWSWRASWPDARSRAPASRPSRPLRPRRDPSRCTSLPTTPPPPLCCNRATPRSFSERCAARAARCPWPSTATRCPGAPVAAGLPR